MLRRIFSTPFAKSPARIYPSRETVKGRPFSRGCGLMRSSRVRSPSVSTSLMRWRGFMRNWRLGFKATWLSCSPSAVSVEVRLCLSSQARESFCIFLGSMFLSGLISLRRGLYFDLVGMRLSMDWLKALFLAFLRDCLGSCRKEELLLLLVGLVRDGSSLLSKLLMDTSSFAFTTGTSSV